MSNSQSTAPKPPACKALRRKRIVIGLLACVLGVAVGITIKHTRYYVIAKRLHVVEPGKIYRGGYCRSWPMQRIMHKYHIRTVLCLMSPLDPRSQNERRRVETMGATWVCIPMHGNGDTTIEDLDRAVEILADPARQPAFFHCTAGVNRAGIVAAAYRIKHQGWKLQDAIDEATRLGAHTDDDPVIAERLQEYRDYLRGSLSRASDLPTDRSTRP